MSARIIGRESDGLASLLVLKFSLQQLTSLYLNLVAATDRMESAPNPAQADTEDGGDAQLRGAAAARSLPLPVL